MTNGPEQVLARIQAIMQVRSAAPPASHDQIGEVEGRLGVPFPEWLREVYLACNGFAGPTGIRYLYPLDGESSVLDFNLFLRSEPWWKDWINRAVIFADNGLGGSGTDHWGVLDGSLVQWNLGNPDRYDVLEPDLYELWADQQARWDSDD